MLGEGRGVREGGLLGGREVGRVAGWVGGNKMKGGRKKEGKERREEGKWEEDVRVKGREGE